MKAILILMASVFGFGQIDQPRIGVMLDQRGDARAVFGVAGSATVSEPVWRAVLSLACSAQLCVAKTNSALISSTGDSIDAPEGSAVLAIDGSSVYAYFPEIGRLVRWHDGQLEPIEFTPAGDVVDLRVTRNGLEYAARRDGKAAILLDDTVLRAADDRVLLVRSDGTESDFPVAGVTSFVRMSEGYVELITPTSRWALRTEPGHEELFLLPGVSQE